MGRPARSRGAFDVIRVVEACYELETDERGWLSGLAHAAHPGLGGFATIAARYTLRDRRVWPGAFAVAGRGAEDQVREFLRIVAESAPDEGMAHAVDVSVMRSVWSFSGMMRMLGRPEWIRWLDRYRRPEWPIRDHVSVSTWLGANETVTLHACADRIVRPSRPARRTWSRVVQHLEAALRLRSTPNRCTEAVLTPDGKCQHAEGPATARSALERLRLGARRIDRARSALRRESQEDALDMWRALVAGRWSLVDRFESDGKRFVLAIRNPPQLTDPRALTERERQVAHLVAQGTSNKMIAYSLGISESTVATQLARALRKLGLRRREELALELSPMRVTDAAPGGADIAIGARPFPALLDGLSEAEQEVVNGVLRGLSDAAIAIARGTSPRTVANQLRSAFSKLGVTSRGELVHRAAQSR